MIKVIIKIIVLIILILIFVLSLFSNKKYEKFQGNSQIDTSNISVENGNILNSGRNYYVNRTAKVGDLFSLGNDLELKYVSNIPQNNYVSGTYQRGDFFSRGNDISVQRVTDCDRDTQYIQNNFVRGSNSQVGSDRVCNDLTVCNFDTQYITQRATITSDRICADLPICGVNQILVGNTNYTPGRCENIGEIIITIRFNAINDVFIKTINYNGSLNNFNNISSINNFFSNKTVNEEKYNIAMNFNSEIIVALDSSTKLILDNMLPCYYQNTNNYINYLFDLKNETIKTHFYNKHKYLDISSIEKINKYVNGPIYLYVLGYKTTNEPMSLFNCKNVVFGVVFKNQNSENIETSRNFTYELIKYDLNMFYEYNKEVALSKKKSDSNYLSNFLNRNIMSNIIPNYKDIIYNKTNSILNTNILIFKNNINYHANQSNQSLINCQFNPRGETLFQCKDMCKNEPNCSSIDCNLICENCTNSNCIWNIKQNINIDLLSPESIVVKGFSGDKLVKLTWIKPSSPSEIIRYYILITSPIETDFLQIYSLYTDRDLCEYIIPDLENEKPYDVHVFAKNDIGISKKSNKITIVPDSNSNLNMKKENSYSNSIENYYRQKKGDSYNMKKEISNFERKYVIQDLKNIIMNDLKINILPSTYNVNII